MATAIKARLRGEFHPLRVASVDRLCDDAVAVTFDVPPELAELYAFRAGQSLTLRRRIDGRDERRSYSICAAEGDRPRIGVREIPDGLFSSWLVRDLRPGDEIEVGTPTGGFTPDVDTPGHHVLLAAGSGITPVLSIVGSVLRHPDATVTLIYGNRRTNTVMFADELADLKDRYPDRLELIHVLSREPREADLFTGRLAPEKVQTLLDLLVDVPRVDHWWLCGPYEMVTATEELLAQVGVEKARIHHELFYVDDVPPPALRHEEAPLEGETSEVSIILDGRTTTTTLDRDTAVLDGAQRVRPDLPFACKGGVCGTCRAKVTEGEVVMRRNFALEDAEVEDGFVLTCQSLVRSEKVVVDYDA
ncbi:1,2-phenylacetyl-CoA epoxidase subunit PaaE [Phytoactinopolyspora mesophila]|uniref:Phenylacetate-CoA oxygenase/reductase subunit PaaK n=1 Tax=Phytoactinopolyspora mesophila TaxID=2650750 RepID=A0A7K3MBM0_9ACTN|nr:1,2-phenylacetyl-CoA epoxidase subunit PaaE [Phytoactinopolyspora mesophila]NDL60666.1 phenylacetate-CoA oxygenase/reductase subunit PaaK [Phytoactinopolyspora mesophila]